jgi:hypothetical protein
MTAGLYAISFRSACRVLQLVSSRLTVETICSTETSGLSPSYTTLQPTKPYVRNHRCENLKQNMASNGRMMNEVKGIWKEAVTTSFEAQFQHSLGGSEE